MDQSGEPGVLCQTTNTPIDPQKTVLTEISLNNAKPDYNSQAAAAAAAAAGPNGGGIGSGLSAGNAMGDAGPGAMDLNGYLGKAGLGFPSHNLCLYKI